MTFAAAAVLLAMWAVRRRTAFAMAGLGAVLIASLALAFVPPNPRIRPGVLEVTSIDVGEGDSTLLVTPEGRTLLVDCRAARSVPAVHNSTSARMSSLPTCGLAASRDSMRSRSLTVTPTTSGE